MKFSTLLQNYRESRGISKKELADEIGVTPTYIGLLEAGSQRAPTLDRCREIACALSLSNDETQRLIDAAVEERMSQETLEWFTEKIKKYEKNGEVDLKQFKKVPHEKVPVYTVEQAAKIRRSSPLPLTTKYELIPTKGATMIAVLFQQDEALKSEFDKGEILVLDLDETPRNGDFVFATNGKSGLFRRLLIIDGKKLLQPINPDYDIIDIAAGEYEITGVVVSTMKKFR